MFVDQAYILVILSNFIEYGKVNGEWTRIGIIFNFTSGQSTIFNSTRIYLKRKAANWTAK